MNKLIICLDCGHIKNAHEKCRDRKPSRFDICPCYKEIYIIAVGKYHELNENLDEYSGIETIETSDNSPT